MKTFKNLKEGSIITNSIDGDMMVCYSDIFSKDNTKELCFIDINSIWLGCQFDPKDWEMKGEKI